MSSGSVAFPSIVQLIMSLHNVSSIPRLPMSFEHLISRLQTRDTRKTQDNPHSSQSSINKLLLQLGNLSLELLNLLPTIQRPTISLVLNTLATLELAAQLGDFLGHGVVAAGLGLRG
jgi:hypothetical protein